MSEGTSRGEAAAHILAREMGRRARAIQARIDDVERARADALAEVQARLIVHDGVDERHAGLIDGLRADLGETHRTALDAVATGDAEVRQLTEAQAALIDRIAQRVTQAEDDNARQDADVEVLTTRVDAVEAKAAVPGPKGEKGDKGDRGPRGPMGPAGFSGAGGGTSGGGGAGTVTSVTAGTGITVGGTSTDPVITNSGVNSVTAGTGISVSGTTALTVTNTGVTSLTGSGVTVSASTGAVTVTAPTVSGGTGISVSGSQTTSLTVTNSGVTSLVAGTNISVSAATGAVTINAPAFATPGSSAFGDTAAAGTATTVSRSDHVHGREAAGTPGASAVGDTAAAGTATTLARSDHRHSREAFGATITASTIGGTAAAGTSTSVAREDHKHAFPAGAAPSALTVSSTQVTGTSTAPALADHVHAMPGSGTAGASAVGDTASAGSATTVALSDHRHSREAFGTPGAVTGGATAASGSATTLARSDHVHSTASLPVLLGRQTLTSGAATVTFSSIPSTYINLHLHIMARNSLTSVAIQNALLRVNGLSTSIYDDGYTSSVTTGITSPSSASGTYRTDGWCELQYVLYNYASSNNRKLVAGVYNINTSSGGIGQASNRTFNMITLTSAITSISISVANTGSDTWVTGSTFDLYGLP